MDDRASTWVIRPAHLDETEILTAIALRSKAHWGYSKEFMAAARVEMTITREQLERDRAYVFEAGGVARGFYKLRGVTEEQVELTDLFLVPEAIGFGWGRILWRHAVERARSLDYRQMTWESDPNAEGFYLRMGAVRCGEVASSVVPGRMLPRMCYPL